MFEEIAAGIIGQGVVYTLLVVMGLIIVDTLLGVVKAIAEGTFDVRLLADYLKTGILPYIGALVILAIGALYVQPEFFGAVFAASAAAVIAKFGTDVIDKSKSLTGAKLATECAVCGDPMPFSMDAIQGEPMCKNCRTLQEIPCADDEEGEGNE